MRAKVKLQSGASWKRDAGCWSGVENGGRLPAAVLTASYRCAGDRASLGKLRTATDEQICLAAPDVRTPSRHQEPEDLRGRLAKEQPWRSTDGNEQIPQKGPFADLLNTHSIFPQATLEMSEARLP